MPPCRGRAGAPWRLARRLRLAALALAAAAAVQAPARAGAPPECIVLEDFGHAALDAFPSGWTARKRAGEAVYSVRQEGPRRYLHARARGLGIQAAMPHEWDLETYPVLRWSWRPRVFPQGADEAHGRNDSALAVYVLVPYSRVVGPKAVKYVWSERVPVGTRLSSNAGLTQVRVLRSGRADAGRWCEEHVNVRDDYRAFFDVTAMPAPAGIAVLTDADDTGSVAEGDYADFRACRS